MRRHVTRSTHLEPLENVLGKGAWNCKLRGVHGTKCNFHANRWGHLTAAVPRGANAAPNHRQRPPEVAANRSSSFGHVVNVIHGSERRLCTAAASSSRARVQVAVLSAVCPAEVASSLAMVSHRWKSAWPRVASTAREATRSAST
jgi:TRAP-type mannitol/chloroaromatic compound transport system substrate-binding protein